MTVLRYDPGRLAPLRDSAAAAFRHLLDARSTEPAAASALRVAASVRGNLEHHWLPAIDRLLASDAMTSWRAVAPPWADGLVGRALGVAIAEHAVDLMSRYRDELADELLVVLLGAASDEAAAASLLEALGPHGLLHLVTTLGTVEHSSLELPLALRAVLAHAATSGSLPDDFGRGLVRAAVAQHEQRGRTGDAGLALSFLFHGGDLPEELIVDAVDEAIALEIAFAERSGLDVANGWSLWLGNGASGALGLWLDFDEPYRGDDLDPLEAQDPMYALLGQLARDGSAGRTVLTDLDRARYLFAERDVLADDGRAIIGAAATAAAGPDVVPTAPAHRLDQASLVASVFVNHFGPANASRVGRDATTSAAAARVVGVHLYGVDHALGWGRGPTDADRSGADPDDAPVHRAGAPDAGTAELSHQVFDEPRSAAVFDPHALGNILDLAARSEEGVEVLRADLATYQRGLAQAAAARIAAGEISASEAVAYLEEAMQDAARLEGQFVQHVGQEAERHGRSVDQARSSWIGAIGEGLDHGGKLFGTAGSAIIDVVADPATDLARRELADAGDDAVAAAERLAVLAGEQLAYVWFRELHAADVLRTTLPQHLLVGGALPSYDDLVVALASGGPPGWTVSTVLQELDDAPGGRVDIDGRAMIDAMTAAQEDFYRGLED